MENNFLKITPEDQDKIIRFITNYGGSDGGDCECGCSCSMSTPLENVLKEWSKSKDDLIKLLNGNLILEKKISFTATIDDKQEELDKLSEHEFVKQLFYWLDTNTYVNSWGYRSEATASVDYSCLTRKALFYNKVTSKFCVDKVVDNDKKTLTINNGTKVTKALKKVMDFYNIEQSMPEILKLYEDFRIAHSMVLNDKSTKGTLCLSVHPLDFMTMSDNSSNWSSCMSWESNGCYRGGTVEMLNSPNVVVAYLKSDKKDYVFDCDKTTWNNKIWRCLMVVDRQIITNVKAYPYQQDAISRIAVEWLAELANENWGTTFSKENVKENVDNPFPCTAPSGEQTRLYITSNGVMYCDMSAVPHIVVCDVNNFDVTKYDSYGADSYSLNYSGKLTCMSCGSEYNFPDGECFVVCYNCFCPEDEENYDSCADCGDPVYYDDGWTNVYGDTVCDYCIKHYYVRDPLTEEYYPISDGIVSVVDDSGAELFRLPKSSKSFTTDFDWHDYAIPGLTTLHCRNEYNHTVMYQVPTTKLSEQMIRLLAACAIGKYIREKTSNYVCHNFDEMFCQEQLYDSEEIMASEEYFKDWAMKNIVVYPVKDHLGYPALVRMEYFSDVSLGANIVTLASDKPLDPELAPYFNSSSRRWTFDSDYIVKGTIGEPIDLKQVFKYVDEYAEFTEYLADRILCDKDFNMYNHPYRVCWGFFDEWKEKQYSFTYPAGFDYLKKCDEFIDSIEGDKTAYLRNSLPRAARGMYTYSNYYT